MKPNSKIQDLGDKACEEDGEKEKVTVVKEEKKK